MLENYETDCASDSTPKTTMELFPCRSPLNSHIRSSDVDMQTFAKNWSVKGQATPREMADAGFYYLDDSNRVICFHCTGGLKTENGTTSLGTSMQIGTLCVNMC